MPVKHGSKAVIKIGTSGSETDISQYVTSVAQPRETDTAEVSALGDNDKEFVAGLKSGTISLEGNFDPTVDANLNTWLGTEQSFVYGPQGGTTGLIKYSGMIILTSYEINTDLGDAGKWSAEGQITGAVTRGTF